MSGFLKIHALICVFLFVKATVASEALQYLESYPRWIYFTENKLYFAAF